ncbi:MAG: TetR family transcriptional regulator [Rhodoferax sp.]|nr:TetR family transcriptional regulator [Rhodoferax sp.]MDP3654271.1 TetR family transcriptional regulator [Rhodoferax sp.]
MRTTMQQIARTAGLGDATFYKYFPSARLMHEGTGWLDLLQMAHRTLDTKLT